MRHVLPLLTAGVGICFLGLELATTGLQESTSRTLRAVIRRSTKSLPWCAVIGVFAGALDIRVAVLFAVGVAGIGFSLTQDFRWKAVVSIGLGVALLLYGSNL